MIEALVQPLQARPLCLNIVLSLAVMILFAPGAVGALVYVTALMIVSRYGFSIIERRAWNDGVDTFGNWSDFNNGFGKPLAMVGVVILFAMAYALTVRNAGDSSALLVLLLINFIGPATIIVIALGGGILDAMNPAQILVVIKRIGFDYLAVFFVLALFSLLGNIVLDLLLSADNLRMRLLVYSFCSYYYVLALFYALGWLVETHREELVG